MEAYINCVAEVVMGRRKIINRLGEERYNNQGCLMKIVKYNNANDIIVEFQDNYKAMIHATYHGFVSGGVKNPYYPSVHGVGIIGIKYPLQKNNKKSKEYETWNDMLKRCFNKNIKEKYATYKEVTCCDEWLLYENFYEWLHNQDNFEKWLNGKRWCLDKDILVKGNKVYSPDTCCLVPNDVNVLFTKRNNHRGDLPIGVIKQGNKFRAECNNPFNDSHDTYLCMCSTPEDAFNIYKEYKENIIKQIAKIEYDNGNITEQCYNAMINYKVEITD